MTEKKEIVRNPRIVYSLDNGPEVAPQVDIDHGGTYFARDLSERATRIEYIRRGTDVANKLKLMAKIESENPKFYDGLFRLLMNFEQVSKQPEFAEFAEKLQGLYDSLKIRIEMHLLHNPEIPVNLEGVITKWDEGKNQFTLKIFPERGKCVPPLVYEMEELHVVQGMRW